MNTHWGYTLSYSYDQRVRHHALANEYTVCGAWTAVSPLLERIVARPDGLGVDQAAGLAPFRRKHTAFPDIDFTIARDW